MTSSDRHSKRASSSFSSRPTLLGAEADDDRSSTAGDSILAAVQHGDDDKAAWPSATRRRSSGARRIAGGLLCLGTLIAGVLALGPFEGPVPQRRAVAIVPPTSGAAAAQAAGTGPSAPRAEAAASAPAVIEAVALASTPLAVGEAEKIPMGPAIASTGTSRRMRQTRLAQVGAAPRAAAGPRHPVGATELDPDAELVAALIARLDRRGAEPAGLRSSGPPPPLPASAPPPAAP